MSFHEYPYPSQRRVAFGRAAVCTSQQLAAQAGRDILKKGGNAIDAAVATAAALTVVEPCSNGIGGDAFAQVWTKEGHFCLNSTGPCPMALNAEVVRSAGCKTMPALGFFPQTVPGIPAAWAELSRRFGRLPFEELLTPAIDYAKNGFAVSPTVAEKWREAAEKTLLPHRREEEFKEWYRVFTDGGKAPLAGDIWRLPHHAKTLAEIAKTKSESFYRGEIAEKIDAYMKKAGGYLRKSDLAAFYPKWTEPISVSFKGYDIWELPPNGQGLIALMALGMLDGVDMPPVDNPKSWHMMIEAIKIAAADGYRFICDPDFKGGMPHSAEELLNGEYLKARAQLIGASAALPTAGNPKDRGTVYLCTADEDGNMVSYIQSNYAGFGSGVVVPDTGIALHDRGAGFSLDENSPNCLEPGKRPYHTIIPGFISKDSKPVGPFGVMGAFMQPQGHLQVLMQMLEYGRNPQSALDAPRFYWTGEKNVSLEHGVPLYIARSLSDMGHNVSYSADRAPFGRGQIIWRQQNGVYAAGTDMRCDGVCAVY